MGTHKGWTIRKATGGKWRALVRLPGRGYSSKTFQDRPTAIQWATVEAAGRLTGAAPTFGVVEVITQEAATAYLKELASLGRAPATLRDVRIILGALGRAFPRLDLTTGPAMEEWINGYQTTGGGRGGKSGAVSPARRNKVLVNVRALCRWAMRRQGLRSDPTEGIRQASVDRTLKPQFTVAEIRKLLGGRDSASRRWVALMLLAGLRADEARTVRWQDIDQAGGVILVRLAAGGKIKRRRERIVPLQAALVPLLGKPGRPGASVVGLAAGNLKTRWAEYLTARKVPADGRTPHSCRHTYAGLMTATGVPSALLGAYLGHSSAQTTMGYTAMAARYAQDREVAKWPRGVIKVSGREAH